MLAITKYLSTVCQNDGPLGSKGSRNRPPGQRQIAVAVGGSGIFGGQAFSSFGDGAGGGDVSGGGEAGGGSAAL